MRRRKHRLFDLEITEVSFCDRGANPEATVEFSKKRDVGEDMTQGEIYELAKRFAKLKVKSGDLTEEQRFMEFWQSDDDDATRLRSLYRNAITVPKKLKPVRTEAFQEMHSIAEAKLAKGLVPNLAHGIAQAAKERPELWPRHLQQRQT